MPSLSEQKPYIVRDAWHSKAPPIRVIHVGAGAAGLLTAYKMQKNFDNFELTCYEK